MGIHFQHISACSLKDRKKLKQAIVNLFKYEKEELGDLTIVFCDDEYLLDINQKFLQHDFYTDIITFDLSGDTSKIIVAELYISVDRVKENAKNNKVTVKNELHRVIFHGCLHLCGYTDKGKESKQIMRKNEDKWLDKYFLKTKR